MSTKFPNPCFRKTRNAWYVTLDGRRVNLGFDKNASYQQRMTRLQKVSELSLRE